MLNSGTEITGKIYYSYHEPYQVFIRNNGKEEKYYYEYVKEVKLESGKLFQIKTPGGGIAMLVQALIISPKVNLYEREISNKVRFYIEKDEEIYELIDSKAVSEFDSKKEYLGILNSLLSNNSEAKERIPNIKLNQENLIELLLLYTNGEVSYIYKKHAHQVRESNYLFFGHFSNYGTYLSKSILESSNGAVVGLQYYISKDQRSSFKIGLEHANINFVEHTPNNMFSKIEFPHDPTQLIGLKTFYQIDFIQRRRSSYYINFHLFDLTYFYGLSDNDSNSSDYDKLFFYPRFSPGIGLDLKPVSRISVYGEMNNLLHFKLTNFTLGLRYDFGESAW